ncbi:DUF2254 domain-containing protein, partial [Photobacterium sp. ZSDE20]|nr:DUF2254 domain-containing protein [Photobacterium sp. ZSDE20]
MLISTVLASGTIWFDLYIHLSHTSMQSWLVSASPDSAAGLISTIATSIITVAGVVFSMTMVVLSLASSQLGPRLLRNFIRDPVTQFGLGIFTSTFLYCLLILAWLLTLASSEVVLQLSLSIAILLALACLLMLIRYIHHVSVFIQADTLIQAVSEELCEAIESLYPDPIEEDDTALVCDDISDNIAYTTPIPSLSSGYVQALDLDRLYQLADEHDSIIKLLYHPGDFLIEQAPIAMCFSDKKAGEELIEKINQFYI